MHAISNVAINNDARLFVIRNGSGVSCLRFYVVFKRLKQIVNYLGLSIQAEEEEIGTMVQYDLYQAANQIVNQANFTSFSMACQYVAFMTGDSMCQPGGNPDTQNF